MLTTQKPLKERNSAWWKCHKQNLQTSWGNRIHSKAPHYVFHKELLKIHRHISTQTQILRNLVENRQIHHKAVEHRRCHTPECAVTCGHGSKRGESKCPPAGVSYVNYGAFTRHANLEWTLRYRKRKRMHVWYHWYSFVLSMHRLLLRPV